MNHTNHPDPSLKSLTREDKNEKSHIYYSSTFGDSFQTYAKVIIDGKEISRENQIQVTIKQSMLTHNHFEFLCPSETFGEKNSYPLTNTQKLMTNRFSVHLIRFKQTTALFEGIITKVEYTAKDGYPYIRLTGNSGTLLMDQNITCHTYINKTLEQIVKSVTDQYKDNRLQVLICPETKEVLPYTVCYNESDFGFLKRLALRYGEYMYHNGEYFVFGRGNQQRTSLFEKKDFQEFSLEVHCQSQHFIRKGYDLRTSTVQSLQSDQITYPDQRNLYHFQSVRSSEQLYTRSPIGYIASDLFYGDSQQLERAVERKKLSNESTVTASSSTDNPHLRLGDIMQMNAWNQADQKYQPIESYRIIEIEHTFTDQGYKNHFRGIPIEQKIAPYLNENAYPHTDSQFAEVIDNNDPEGLNRLKIRFFWQKENESTLWVPLIQGHSGGGQGSHVIPETGHIVWVDFLGHNAEAPLVIGSMYSGDQKSGFHTQNNDLKVFQTRSGTKRIVNDFEGSILEEDKAGSFIKLEGDGNVTINVVKNLTVEAGENVNFTTGNNNNLQVGGNSKFRIQGTSHCTVRGTADIDVQGDLTVHTDKNMVTHSYGDIENQSKGETFNNSGKKVKNNSKNISKIH
jgi:type VI secretion system secreted protein VgrG